MPEGSLLVCATPIGNLGDVTLRVLEALREADAVLAEDTRVSRKLFSRYDIDTPMEAFHAHNIEARIPSVIARVREGARVAVVSDAGTPGISDPGAVLVDACLEEGLAVEVLPGASAIVTALVASGLPTYSFYFGGFLPRKPGPMRRALEALTDLDATLVFYESPKRTAETLRRIAEVLPGRKAAMARELTKLHEEVLRADVEQLAGSLVDRQLKGEVVLLIGPPSGEQAAFDEEAVGEAVRRRIESGESVRDAARAVAQELGLSKNAVYRIAVGLGGD